MKNVIWCEVTCGCCGAAANASGYYSPDRIKRLKAETKDWVDDENYRVLCPACVAKIRPQKSKEKTNYGYDEAIAATIASGKAEQILASDKAKHLTEDNYRSKRAKLVPLVDEFGDLLALVQEDVVPDVINEEKE